MTNPDLPFIQTDDSQSTPEEPVPQLDPKDSIDILMREYETLRTEILHRIRNRFAIVGYVGVVMMFIFTKSKEIPWPDLFGPLYKYNDSKDLIWPLAVLACTSLFLLFYWLQEGRLMLRCSSRITEIEKTANELSGRELLVWETRVQSSWLRRILNRL